MLPPLLRMAIKVGSLETVKSALKQGVDPNIQDSEGNSLLLSALRSRQFHICQYLLENGANPEAKSKVGISAIDLAKVIDETNELQLWQLTGVTAQDLESEHDPENDWIEEKEINLPSSDDIVISRARNYQATTAEWDPIDRDESWEEIDIEFPVGFGGEKEKCAYYNVILELFASASVYGVIDPSLIRSSLEISGFNHEIENQELLSTTEFILSSLGVIVEACTESGYVCADEPRLDDISELDWNEFFESIYRKKINSLTMFQRSLRAAKVISREEEKLLFEELKKEPSNEVIRRKIITANLRFAYKMAGEFYRNGDVIGIEDHISEALYGMLLAIDRFDVNLENKFITYASFWIRQRIQKLHFDHDRNVRIPANKMALIYRFKRAVARNGGDYLKTLQQGEFVESATEITEILEALEEIPLDSLAWEENGDEVVVMQLGSLMSEGEQEKNSEIAELKKLLGVVMDGLLSEREAKVLRMYYGIDYAKDFTFDEIGRELRLTRERVRQIKNKCLDKLLKNKSSSDILFPFLSGGPQD